MKKNKEINPSSSVRGITPSSTFRKRSRPCHSSERNRPKRYCGPGNTKLTLFGLYETKLLDIQNSREWSDDSCKKYDRFMCRILGPLTEKYAVSEITIEDYLDIWQDFLLTKPKQGKINDMFFLIRYLAELAMKERLSDVVFWGSIEQRIVDPSFRKKYAVKNSDEDGAWLELVGVRIPDSLSLAAELRLLTRALEMINKHGELIAGILMFLLGMRTSEACGAKYSDLVEVLPGYWGIKRETVRDSNTGEIDVGGKTENSYRIIPLPRFLAILLDERRKLLKAQYPDEDTDNWTIACEDDNYSISADQKRVNSMMNRLYYETGCDEDLMAHALYGLRTDEKEREDCENSLVAYLGRHQMLTEIVATGMPEEYIYALAGHAQRDDTADRADFTNPDIFKDVSDFLNRRPIVWLLDSDINNLEIQISPDTSLAISSDGETNILFQSDDEEPFQFCIAVSEHERLDPINIETSGDISYKIMQGPVPDKTAGKGPLSMGPYLRQMISEMLTGDAEFEPNMEEGEYQDDFTVSVVMPAPLPQVSLPVKPAFRRKVSSKPKSVPKEPAIARIADVSLFALDSLGSCFAIPPEYLVRSSRGTLGNKLNLSKRSRLQMVIPYRAALLNYVVTKSGLVYPLPGFEMLDSVLADPAYAYLKDAFMDRAVLLTLPDNTSPDNRLVFFTDRGRIACFPAALLKDVRTCGAQMAEMDQVGEAVVSACILEPDQDLLLVTWKGMALRLAGSSIKTRKTKGIQPWNGIRLLDGDRAVQCIPHCPELLVVKENGNVAALKVELSQNTTLNSIGSQMAVDKANNSKVVSVFQRSDAIVMADSKGFLFITDADDFTSKGKNIGIKAKKIKDGSELVSAFGVNYSP